MKDNNKKSTTTTTIKFDSIELLFQTPVWNTAVETFRQTNDLFKTLNTPLETSNKNWFTIPFLAILGCDMLKFNNLIQIVHIE